MIDRELLKRGPSAGRKLEKTALRNHETCSSHVPALAALPGALERGKVGLQQPASGKSRFIYRSIDGIGHYGIWRQP
jgi:hypothetical protein